MNPAQYPQEVYQLLYADENGEIVGLEEVQYLDPVPTERISALVTLLASADRYLAYQSGLILTAWGIAEGVTHLHQLAATRADLTTAFEPHRLWAEDNVYDVMAQALSMALRYTSYDKRQIVGFFSELLQLYGECYFESKLKSALLACDVPELAPDIKCAMQLALAQNRGYQASQLLPVLAKYDKPGAQVAVGRFKALLQQAGDKRIQYNLDEAQQYL